MQLTYVVLFLRFMKSYVLSYEYSDSNAAEIEAVQKLVDLRKLCQPCPRCQLLLEICHSHSHHRYDIAAAKLL